MTAAGHAFADDATLARGVASGDAASLAAIFDRYGGPLLGFCTTMLRRPADAEDCVQDVFVIAATRLSDLREPALLRSWLFSVARHECLRRLDRRHRELLMDDLPDQPSALDEPATAALDAELAAILRDAYAGLSDRDRLLLELADRQQLSGDELARAVGVPRATAYTLVARARTTARISLGALLVARTGRAQCADLDRLLGDWDGRLTTLRRKQLARHIDGCAICTEQRKRVATPAALLGEGHAFAATLVAMRARILTAAGAALATGSPAAGAPMVGDGRPGGPGWVDGWPPADLAPRRRRRWLTPIAGLLVLLLIGGGAFVTLHRGDRSESATVTTLLTSASPPPPSSASSSSPTTPSTPLAVVTVPATIPRAPVSHGSVSATVSATPTPAPTSASSTSGPPWLVTLNTATYAASVTVNSIAQPLCEAKSTCTYVVPDRASVRIVPRLGTFTAPQACAGSANGCTVTATANLTATIITPTSSTS